MQTLQWGVSHPEMMDALIALTPMAHTPAWSIAVNEATRKALTADSAYNNGDYTQQPEKGWRAWVDVLLTLATRTPDGRAGRDSRCAIVALRLQQRRSGSPSRNFRPHEYESSILP